MSSVVTFPGAFDYLKIDSKATSFEMTMTPFGSWVEVCYSHGGRALIFNEDLKCEVWTELATGREAGKHIPKQGSLEVEPRSKGRWMWRDSEGVNRPFKSALMGYGKELPEYITTRTSCLFEMQPVRELDASKSIRLHHGKFLVGTEKASGKENFRVHPQITHSLMNNWSLDEEITGFFFRLAPQEGELELFEYDPCYLSARFKSPGRKLVLMLPEKRI